MESIFLICFGVGLTFTLLAVLTGSGHLHIGHLHIGHIHTGKTITPHTHGFLHALNGFTIPAFLCWFGGAGYLMARAHILPAAIVLLLASLSGIAGSSLIYALLFKVLMPRERVLAPGDTDMYGVIARVSSQIRSGETGEILFTQLGTRRAAAARSEDGLPIARDTEVVVLRYERGIAYVRLWEESLPTDRPVQAALSD
ncbi:hypothetical protein [Granulicella sibirica]|uniref:Membrane protein NfeD2 N-terminal transmembrane domain-containing protein n=1 Tax=Granulicella sibirica TaxID=2479048 RepID=A0A4Q0T899_9BACT|nr:hypothetical protein [Granulicella sibirica]RXH58378.1 hypothetical protein GRAN_1688 [Granulicella sibirica]